MKRYIYILFCLLNVLTACEREIPYNGEYQDPKLVIQTLLCSGDDTVTCFIGRSYFFLNSKPSTPNPVEGVMIDMRASSGSLRILNDSISGNIHYLQLSEPLKAGDTIRVSATHPDFGTAYSDEVLGLDYEPVVLSARWEKGQEYEQNNCRFVLRLPDYSNPQAVVTMKGKAYVTFTTVQPRFLNGEFSHYQTIVTHHTRNVIASTDNLFDQQNNRYSRYNEAYWDSKLMFRANYTSGRDLEIYMPISSRYDYTETKTTTSGAEYNYYRTYQVDSCELWFEINGESYLWYEKSMNAYFGLNEETEEMDLGVLLSDMIGIEEPAAIYSNVQNGYGIVMSQTRTKVKIKEFAE